MNKGSCVDALERPLRNRHVQVVDIAEGLPNGVEVGELGALN